MSSNTVKELNSAMGWDEILNIDSAVGWDEI